MVGEVFLDHEFHKYFVDGKPFPGPSVTQALAQCGIADFSFVDEEIRERSMARGQSAHWMLALHDQGALDYRRVPKAMRGYRKAWMEFRKNTGFTPERDWIERSFASPMGYCGTVDRKGSFLDAKVGWCVLDLKTENVPAHAKFQLALYAKAIHVIGRIAVALRSDGTYTTKVYPVNELGVDYAIGIESVRRWRPDANH